MTKILVCVVAVIWLLSGTALAQDKPVSDVPCGETRTQVETNECAQRDYQKADAEMNKVYRQLMTELASYGGNDQQKLRTAQTLWLQYRDANCESESSIYLGGSIRPAIYSSCLASVTRERSRRLTEFLAVTNQ